MPELGLKNKPHQDARQKRRGEGSGYNKELAEKAAADQQFRELQKKAEEDTNTCKLISAKIAQILQKTLSIPGLSNERRLELQTAFETINKKNQALLNEARRELTYLETHQKDKSLTPLKSRMLNASLTKLGHELRVLNGQLEKQVGRFAEIAGTHFKEPKAKKLAELAKTQKAVDQFISFLNIGNSGLKALPFTTQSERNAFIRRSFEIIQGIYEPEKQEDAQQKLSQLAKSFNASEYHNVLLKEQPEKKELPPLTRDRIRLEQARIRLVCFNKIPPRLRNITELREARERFDKAASDLIKAQSKKQSTRKKERDAFLEKATTLVGEVKNIRNKNLDSSVKADAMASLEKLKQSLLPELAKKPVAEPAPPPTAEPAPAPTAEPAPAPAAEPVPTPKPEPIPTPDSILGDYDPETSSVAFVENRINEAVKKYSIPDSEPLYIKIKDQKNTYKTKISLKEDEKKLFEAIEKDLVELVAKYSEAKKDAPETKAEEEESGPVGLIGKWRDFMKSTFTELETACNDLLKKKNSFPPSIADADLLKQLTDDFVHIGSVTEKEKGIQKDWFIKIDNKLQEIIDKAKEKRPEIERIKNSLDNFKSAIKKRDGETNSVGRGLLDSAFNVLKDKEKEKYFEGTKKAILNLAAMLLHQSDPKDTNSYNAFKKVSVALGLTDSLGKAERRANVTSQSTLIAERKIKYFESNESKLNPQSKNDLKDLKSKLKKIYSNPTLDRKDLKNLESEMDKLIKDIDTSLSGGKPEKKEDPYKVDAEQLRTALKAFDASMKGFFKRKKVNPDTKHADNIKTITKAFEKFKAKNGTKADAEEILYSAIRMFNNQTAGPPEKIGASLRNAVSYERLKDLEATLKLENVLSTTDAKAEPVKEEKKEPETEKRTPKELVYEDIAKSLTSFREAIQNRDGLTDDDFWATYNESNARITNSLINIQKNPKSDRNAPDRILENAVLIFVKSQTTEITTQKGKDIVPVPITDDMLRNNPSFQALNNVAISLDKEDDLRKLYLSKQANSVYDTIDVPSSEPPPADSSAPPSEPKEELEPQPEPKPEPKPEAKKKAEPKPEPEIKEKNDREKALDAKIVLIRGKMFEFTSKIERLIKKTPTQAESQAVLDKFTKKNSDKSLKNLLKDKSMIKKIAEQARDIFDQAVAAAPRRKHDNAYDSLKEYHEALGVDHKNFMPSARVTGSAIKIKVGEKPKPGAPLDIKVSKKTKLSAQAEIKAEEGISDSPLPGSFEDYKNDPERLEKDIQDILAQFEDKKKIPKKLEPEYITDMLSRQESPKNEKVITRIIPAFQLFKGRGKEQDKLKHLNSIIKHLNQLIKQGEAAVVGPPKRPNLDEIAQKGLAEHDRIEANKERLKDSVSTFMKEAASLLGEESINSFFTEKTDSALRALLINDDLTKTLFVDNYEARGGTIEGVKTFILDKSTKLLKYINGYYNEEEEEFDTVEITPDTLPRGFDKYQALLDTINSI